MIKKITELYRQLTEILLDSKLTDHISEQRELISQTIQNYNDCLEIEHGSFISEDTINDNIIITPRCLSAFINKPKDKLDLVFFNLNPRFEVNKTFREKELMGDSWKNYFENHINGNFHKHVLERSNSQYINMTKVLLPLLHNYDMETMSKSNMRQFLKDSLSDTEINDYELFTGTLKDKNTMFPELIPFHLSQNGLHNPSYLLEAQNMDSYRTYVESLVNFVEEELSQDGYIVANTKASSDLIEPSLIDNGWEVITDNSAMKILVKKSQMAILLKYFVRIQNTALNTDKNIKDIFSEITKIKKMTMPTDAVIEQFNRLCTNRETEVKNTRRLNKMKKLAKVYSKKGDTSKDNVSNIAV